MLNNQPHGRAADVYSLGSFVIEMTIGVPTLETLQDKVSFVLQRNHFVSENDDSDKNMANKTSCVNLVDKGGAGSHNLSNL